MKTAILIITGKVPKEHRESYSGVCLYKDEEGKESLYFGWRGPINSNLCFPHGNCVQKAIILMDRHKYDEVILEIDAEFTEYKQAKKIKITSCK